MQPRDQWQLLPNSLNNYSIFGPKSTSYKIGGLKIDNPTKQWWQIQQTGDIIPAYTLGWARNFTPFQGTITLIPTTVNAKIPNGSDIAVVYVYEGINGQQSVIDDNGTSIDSTIAGSSSTMGTAIQSAVGSGLTNGNVILVVPIHTGFANTVTKIWLAWGTDAAVLAGQTWVEIRGLRTSPITPKYVLSAQNPSAELDFGGGINSSIVGAAIEILAINNTGAPSEITATALYYLQAA